MTKITERNLPLAVTMGEPAGIGTEISIKAWAARREADIPAYFLLAPPSLVHEAARIANLDVSIAEIDDPSVTPSIFADHLPVLPIELAAPATLGEPNPRNAAAVLQSISRAVELSLAGHVAAIVTNPIQKATLYAAGFRHQGHTDYLASLCPNTPTPVMMLAAPELRVVPVTVHMSLRQAIDGLTTEDIVCAGAITAGALRRDFACPAPRLAVAGLNPHAGESGALGSEEAEIIEPAIATLRAKGIDVTGPMVPDAMFHAAAREGYDAALCMYHDQALIPLKTLNFEQGVNVTLGLDFVRTSPDHGTALALAGTGRASPNSLIAAQQLAASIAARRAAFDAETT